MDYISLWFICVRRYIAAQSMCQTAGHYREIYFICKHFDMYSNSFCFESWPGHRKFSCSYSAPPDKSRYLTWSKLCPHPFTSFPVRCPLSPDYATHSNSIVKYHMAPLPRIQQYLFCWWRGAYGLSRERIGRWPASKPSTSMCSVLTKLLMKLSQHVTSSFRSTL